MLSKHEMFARSVSACIENGRNLLADAEYLFGFDRFSTALALSVLAQEEFAKAFLLQLVADDALPWLREVKRSISKHQCKHLLAIVMEWLPVFDWEEIQRQSKKNEERHEQKMAWYERSKSRDYVRDPADPEPVEEEFLFPREVADALNIYRHIEIEKLRPSGNPWLDEEWTAGNAGKIAQGSLDRKKQSALYVDIGKTGEVGVHPGLITREESLIEMERAKRLSEAPITCSNEYWKVKQILPLIFADLEKQATVRG